MAQFAGQLRIVPTEWWTFYFFFRAIYLKIYVGNVPGNVFKPTRGALRLRIAL